MIHVSDDIRITQEGLLLLRTHGDFGWLAIDPWRLVGLEPTGRTTVPVVVVGQSEQRCRNARATKREIAAALPLAEWLAIFAATARGYVAPPAASRVLSVVPFRLSVVHQ